MAEPTTVCNIKELCEQLTVFRERLLADLIQLAQMRSASGEEASRVRFMRDRLTQGGVPNVGTDAAGNAVGVVPGSEGERTIMIVAHLDSAVPKETDLNASIAQDRAIGAGISGSPLAASVLCLLPEVMTHIGFKPKSTIQIVGSVASRGRASTNGLHQYLEQLETKPDIGVVLEGTTLGKINCFSIGSLRGNIVVNTEARNQSGYGAESALVVITRIVNRLLAIPVPRRPYTAIRLGRLRAGYSHDIEPDHAELGFEVVSYDEDILERVRGDINDAVAEMKARYQAEVQLDVFHSRSAGGLSFSHPLVKRSRAVLDALDIEPEQSHTAGELAHFIKRSIPAVTLGVSRGRRNLKANDYALIEPAIAGMAQVIGILKEIDEGNCDDA